ncbi:MAG: uracil-DNA glycosylase [Planctomycetia bacterium]
MSVERLWRQRVEALRRAGLDYVQLEHLEGRTVDAEEPPAAAIQSAALVTEELDPMARPPKPSLFDEPQDSTPGGLPPIAGPERTVDEKTAALTVLAAQVAGCTKCAELSATRTQPVFADGKSGAELCFVGEAPGADEDRQGVPFVGRAGQLLDRIITACKIDRQDVYICNVLKCRPPNNRPPEPAEVENCRGYLEQQLEILRPKLIVALGKHAAAWLLNKKATEVAITKIRGELFDYRGIPVLPTYHPSYLLRNPAAKREVWDDMKKAMREIGKPVD